MRGPRRGAVRIDVELLGFGSRAFTERQLRARGGEGRGFRKRAGQREEAKKNERVPGKFKLFSTSWQKGQNSTGLGGLCRP